MVTAYVAKPLCAEAERGLAQEGPEAGGVRVRVVCLRPVGTQKLDLAAVGANARRATEDSTSVAYLEADGPANRFARPVLEAAGIAWVRGDDGAVAIGQVLDAVAAADTGSLRESVRETLG